MIFCNQCGTQLNAGTKFCGKCGAQAASTPVQQQPIQAAPQYMQQQPGQTVANPNDAPSGGFAVLSFFLPLLALILWIVWKDSNPQKANSCKKGGIVGVVVELVFVVIIVLLLL